MSQSIHEHVKEKYAGGTCGGSEGILTRFHQLRVDVARDMVRDHLWKRDTGVPVLDVGCNDGTVSCQLQALGCEMHGLDLDEGNVRRAIERGVQARVGNAAEGLPFDDGAFEVVFAGEILEHLYDPEAFMREVHRVLRRGGALVVTTPNLASLGNRLRLLLGRYPRLLSPFLSEGMGDHIHLFTADTLQRLFEKTGFYLADLSSSSITPRLGEGFREPFFPTLAGLYPTLGDLLIAKGQKI